MKKFLLVLTFAVIFVLSIAMCVSATDSTEATDGFIILGDVDGDGQVTNADVLMIYRYIYNPELYPLPTICNHDFGEWRIERESNCGNDGLITRSCVKCGKVDEKVIDATGRHTEVIDKAVESTCTNTGLTEGKHCDICGKVLIEQIVVAALGHDYKDTVFEPTQTEQGYTNHTCSTCGDSYNDNFVPATGSIGLEFTSNGDNTCYVSGIGTCTDTDVVIPAKSPAGDSVTSIGEWAFSNCYSLKSVTFAENSKLTSIGESAFRYCSSLESIVIPESVTSVGDYAFYSCASLANITVDVNNKNYVSVDGNLYSKDETKLIQYAIGKTDKAFVIPASVTSICGYAFHDCTSIESITFAENSKLMSIGNYAFYYCPSLMSIDIPAGVTFIGYGVFHECISLTNITVDGNNENYTSVDGSLYSKDKTKLIQYAIGKTNNAFVIPPEVTSVGEGAVYGCTSLTSITIPAGMTNLDNYSFSWCTALESINFGGTVSQWLEINKGLEWDTSTGDYTVYCIDGKIAKDGTVTYISVGLEFTSNGDGTCYVSGIGTCTDTNIIIPEKSPAGDTVTSIGEKAFYRCKSIVSITIPASVTSIGNYAFNMCYKLVEVYNLSGLNITAGKSDNGYVGLYAINVYTSTRGKSKLQTTEDGYILYEDGDTRYLLGYKGDKIDLILPEIFDGNDYEIYKHAFSDYTSLKSVVVPDNVTSIGNSAFSGCTSLTSVTFSENSKLTSIGESAFHNNAAITSITIPSSVTSVGYGAFNDCEKLIKKQNNVYYVDKWVIACERTASSVTLRADTVGIGDRAFYTCLFYSITIPSNVKSIGELAFYDCTSLNSITIPANVTKIGDEAFQRCTSLKSVTFAKNSKLKSIGYGAFYSCIVLTNIEIPHGVTMIGDYTFYRCASLKSISIPDSVTSIGVCAFDNTNLVYNEYDNAYYIGNLSNPYLILIMAKDKTISSCYVHNNTKIIYFSAFNNCTSLANVKIPAGVKSIRDDAFYGCTSLKSVYIWNIEAWLNISFGNYASNPCNNNATLYLNNNRLISLEIPTSITSIRDYAFYGCSSLESIEIPDSVTSIGNSAFYNCSVLTSVDVPNSVMSIGDETFRGCTSLKSITFAENSKLTSIGHYAFYSCGALVSIEIPDGVLSIDYYAFAFCKLFKSITLPASVTSIGPNAFYGCISLKNIIFEDATTWYRTTNSSYSSGIVTDVTTSSTNATYFKSTYCNYYWCKK